MNIKQILILITFLILLYWLIRNLKQKNIFWLSIHSAKDDDFKKIKTIPNKIGLKCQECLIESGKCCDNCSAQEQQHHYLVANHCQEHNHSHHHHQHEHKHSSENKDLISLLFLPILLVIFIYRVIKLLGNFNKVFNWYSR
ncbi:MAG: Lipoprotein signal peptidase [Mycoplasmataceae bacterium]|nr:MAG: Lipoprotein signal peptidase [Mycoplasmataceae bacterium]